MTKFEEIIDSIRKELEELRKINNDLARENTDLREKLNKNTSSEVAFISVDEAFRTIKSKNSKSSITRAYNVVKSQGYENIFDLQGVPFYKWEGVGDNVATVIALVLEHYGIKPAIPPSGGGYRNSYPYRKDSFYFK